MDLECPSRRWSVGLFFLWGAGLSVCLGEPVAVSPRWQASFPATSNGNPSESTAVPVSDGSALVVVVAAGADAASPQLQLGKRETPASVIGHDPVSRLGFLQPGGGMTPKSMTWLESAESNSNTALNVLDAGTTTKCRTAGWVNQVGGKILPFALLRVNFSRAVPPPGTPLLDAAGNVVAVVFQSAGSGDTGYAIPAEAVHRVHRDITTHGRLVRGWLGLSLRADSQVPKIIRVLPDSPAAAEGVRPDDVLLSIGYRQIKNYADAANAFFYLIPGEPVKVMVLRGAEPLEFTITPTKPKS
ncbi:MAG: S1C family serine protease [Luteolibacter sp.]